VAGRLHVRRRVHAWGPQVSGTRRGAACGRDTGDGGASRRSCGEDEVPRYIHYILYRIYTLSIHCIHVTYLLYLHYINFI